MAKRSLPLRIALIAAVLFLAACSQSKPYAGSSSDFYWECDQARISPEDGTLSVWTGFVVEDGAFRSGGREAALALWRRTPLAGAQLKITYQLGSGRAVFSSPGLKAGRINLAASAAFRQIACRVDLNAGPNILAFRAKRGGQLKIKEITAGDGAERKHLERGDSLGIYPAPGEGEVTLKGKGAVEIRTSNFTGTEGEGAPRWVKTGIFSSHLRIPFAFTDRGSLKITVASGRFDIASYSIRPAPRSAPRPSGFTAKPNIFIVLLDACQAAHLGAYGYRRPTSPNIDQLARDAVVFENAYANATYTRASIPSFFTGLFPDSDDMFARAKVTLPRFLNAQGYKVNILSTSFFVSDLVRFPRQGVETLDYFPDWRLPSEKERIARRFCQLQEQPAPRFVYLHYLEPHLPSLPPPPYRDMFRGDGKPAPGGKTPSGKASRAAKVRTDDKAQWEQFFGPDDMGDGENSVMFRLWHDKKYRHSTSFTPEQVQQIVDDYDSSIAYIDAEVGKLLDCLKRRGIYEDSLIVVMADHGEALYEHKEWFHGNNVFEETSRVPLIVKFPKAMKLTGRAARVVQLLDLLPTLADACGQSLPLEGRSLIEAAVDPGLDDTLAISRSGHKIPVYGARWRNWYYMYDRENQSEKLFDLLGDPRLDVHAEHPGICRMLFLRLSDRARGERADDAGQGVDVSRLPKKEIENLKALGYL